MAAATLKLHFDTTFDAPMGVPFAVAPGIVRITAPNAGPFTFKGTNTFVLGGDRVAVVDPGPEDAGHLKALRAHIGQRPLDAVILSHTHRDHSDLAGELAAAAGAPLWFGGQHRASRDRRMFEMDWVRRESDYDLVPDRVLEDGELVEIAGLHLDVVATPGHCANHLCFGIAGTPWMLSGDHVMGWNSTMIAVPDGSMADYLGSLTKVSELPYRHYLPAHGGPIADGPDFARALRAHRESRNRQIIEAVAKGARNVADLVKVIYPELAAPLIPAARMTITAHIEYLGEKGLIAARQGLLGVRLSPVPSD